MKNVLHWSAPEGTGDGVLYKVKYSVYGVGKWIRKPECRNINRTWCDLSSETSDYEEQYYASVKAFLNGMCSDWMETTRFNPLTDTKIDPPMINVSSTEKSISIILTAPEKWKRSPEGESVSLLQVYPGLQYNVSVLNKKTKKRWWFSISNNTLVVPWLEPGTAYCVSAQIHVSTPLLHSGFSKEYCIATLKDKTADETITIVFGCVLPIILAVLFISMACYCVHRYIHVSKQKHPTNLVWHYTDKCKESVFIPCDKIVVNLITVNVDEYKPSQEYSHLSERKSPHYYTVYNGIEGNDLPSKEMLETKHLLDISHEEVSHKEDILAEGDQAGNWPSYSQPRTKNTLRQKNALTVEYEHDVKAEDFSPSQKLEEKTSVSRGLLGEPQIALEALVNMKTGQPYCPQLELRAAEPCLGQKIEEFNLKMVDGADELPGETHINLVDLDTEKSGQMSYPQLEEMSQGLMEKGGEETILVNWDPHTGRLYIPTLCSVENQVCEAVFKCDDPDKEGILSRLYEKEVSDELSEDQEMYLLQFKEQWGLHVEMEH
ncbi:interleukin-20 receptor subunit alpha isoform X1 [Tyto alba]|uniref:interleukin-20 receptor subunit alpha isoform X1 n=1 Tax=Tyto alba TaxID=56313 RepID=UPI001C68690C|nr:interleukin-20 receptor subunit alpha isoform X1 [Tyto alba]XP_042652145.1 interleukin-20 receptor subunit alpha isoform X1 [Tyto alba]XP_042652146.1 interleukin-20 receptor subunit alpha isoform X1 [Tyto alba]